MSERFTFIVNPSAAKGNAGRLVGPLTELLISSKLEHSIVLTQRRGHATELARCAEGKYVVVVGGDGTINEAANGIVGTGKVLGIIPAGSGNDFIKSVGIPRRMPDAFARLHNLEVRKVDVGTVACSASSSVSSNSSRVFLNGVGVGFDAAVAERTQQIPWLTGTLLYLAAVLQTLRTYRSPLFKVEADKESWTLKQLLIAIGNGRCAGGGFFLTPHAVVDDGILDVTAIEDVPIPTILRLMPQVMRGKTIQDRAVRYLRARNISLQAERPFMVHADGEIVGKDVTMVHIGLHKERLNLLV